MMLLLPTLALAAEPGHAGGPVLPALPSPGGELVLGWDQVGLSPGRTEEAPYGPDHLAAGPDGAWAIWDPVHRLVVGSGFELRPRGVDGLAFAPDGDVLVLNDGARTLERWSVTGSLVERVPLSGLSPVGATLDVQGDQAYGRDVFGNRHPLASLADGGLGPVDGARLLAAPHQVRVQGGKLAVDGASYTLPGNPAVVGARELGDWIIVETGARGAISGRWAIPVATGEAVALPLRSAGAYRPSEDVAVAADGALGYLAPQSDGLHLVRVRP